MSAGSLRRLSKRRPRVSRPARRRSARVSKRLRFAAILPSGDQIDVRMAGAEG